MWAVSLLQPWASLCALGVKRIETRTWAPSYRGPLAIHASKKISKEIEEICAGEPMRSILRLCDVDEVGELPLGVVVGVVRLVDCFQFGSPAQREYDHLIDGYEPDLGNHARGRWGWVFEDALLAEAGLKVNGALGLWNWPEPARRSYLRKPWVVGCATPGCASRASVGTRARSWPGGFCDECRAGYGPVQELGAQTGGPYPLALPPARAPAVRRVPGNGRGLWES